MVATSIPHCIMQPLKDGVEQLRCSLSTVLIFTLLIGGDKFLCTWRHIFIMKGAPTITAMLYNYFSTRVPMSMHGTMQDLLPCTAWQALGPAETVQSSY